MPKLSNPRLAARLTALAVAVLVTAFARADAAVVPADNPIAPVAALDVAHLPIGAMLSWRCDADAVAGFNVERSTDGFVFEVVARVTIGDDETYNFLDTDRPAARTYYRITSFDGSGTSAHSPLAEAAAVEPSRWYLNGGYTVEPAAEFAFEIEAAGVEMLACELHDLTGEPVFATDLLVQPGPNRLTVPTDDLDAGAYTLSVSGADLTETISFMKTSAATPAFQPLVRGN